MGEHVVGDVGGAVRTAVFWRECEKIDCVTLSEREATCDNKVDLVKIIRDMPSGSRFIQICYPFSCIRRSMETPLLRFDLAGMLGIADIGLHCDRNFHCPTHCVHTA